MIAPLSKAQGVYDAYAFNLIALVPDFNAQAANQKNQIDQHFEQTMLAYSPSNVI
jgi:hypothetical protein